MAVACLIDFTATCEKEFDMSKHGKKKGEKMFADAQKKSEQAADEQQKEQQTRADHTASLKAQRLAKKASDAKLARLADKKAGDAKSARLAGKRTATAI
jgi:hypothetical protein